MKIINFMFVTNQKYQYFGNSNIVHTIHTVHIILLFCILPEQEMSLFIILEIIY